MKTLKTLFLLTFVFLFFKGNAQTLNDIKSRDELPPNYKVNYYIDNMKYWGKMAELGLVPVEPYGNIKPAKYTNSKIFSSKIVTDDSPDVPVTTEAVEQSENSVFIDPVNSDYLLNSNNSTPIGGGSIYGANYFVTEDGGQTYNGQIEGAGGSNNGDPTTAIGLNGWLYTNFISEIFGQGISYSQDDGTSWTQVLIASPPGGGLFSMLDKNHMWIDNSPTSPYEGNIYVGWTPFGGSNNLNIEISRSTNGGLNWSSAVNVSQAINDFLCQGVNIQTGPNGEVYAAFSIFNTATFSDESSIGFARSFDGGATWETPFKIIDNIRGIRASGTSKDMRGNSFPSMAVDISTENTSGNIYLCWTNIGVPGINTGDDIDIYMIKSVDGGDNWSNPTRINQDPVGLGNEHYLPWMACDPENGNLSAIYYDDRNVGGADCEVFCSISINAGETWDDFKVSDVSFTPSPIPGLADDYMGDYLAIQAKENKVYPCWTDNRSGTAMTYVSPFYMGPPPNQPWIIYETYAINDAAGNNNGQLDHGETVNLDITMKNIGDQPATDVVVTLTTGSNYVILIDDQENFGNFAVDEQKTLADAYSFSVDNTVPHNEQIIFTLTSSDVNDSTSVSSFKINANAPHPEIINFIIEDPNGDQDNYLDPGEDAIIKVEIQNSGASDAIENNIELISNTNFITVNTQTLNIDTINTSDTYVLSYDISVSNATPIGFVASMTCNLTSQYHSATADFNTAVGLIIEDWETGDVNKFNWEFSGDADWFITSSVVYEGTYSLQSGNINNNQSTVVSLEYDVLEDGEISFYRKVDSETAVDFLQFFIDDVSIGDWASYYNWEGFTYPVSAGMHTFKWEYSKDGVGSSGADAAWIDNIVLPTPKHVGMEELFDKLDYQLYPNPNTGKFTIQMKSDEDIKMRFKVINILGGTILENEDIIINGTFRKEFDLQGISSGTYYIVFTYKQSVFSQKIIVN